MLVLIVNSYFTLFMRLFLSAQECAHVMGRILLGLGGSEIGIPTNIVPITLLLALIVFFPTLSFLKMPVNLNQYTGISYTGILKSEKSWDF